MYLDQAYFNLAYIHFIEFSGSFHHYNILAHVVTICIVSFPASLHLFYFTNIPHMHVLIIIFRVVLTYLSHMSYVWLIHLSPRCQDRHFDDTHVKVTID